MRLKLRKVSTTATDPTSSDSIVENFPVIFNVQANGPTITCSDLSTAYFPGDGEIIVNTLNLGASRGTNAGPLKKILVQGSKTGNPDTTIPPPSSNDVSSTVDYGGSAGAKGFTNTTDGTDFNYTISFNAMDSADVYPAAQSACRLTPVQTSKIEGFLGGNQCFIATASFQSEHHWVVEGFREFRDAVLARFQVGRIAIEVYYKWSPKLASWVDQLPALRVIALGLLIPVEAVMFLVLHPKIVLLPFLILFSIGWIFRKLRVWMGIGILGLGLGMVEPVYGAGINPSYIEEIKKEIAEEDAKKKEKKSNDESGSYIETIRATLPKYEERSLIKEVKEEIAEEDRKKEEKKKSSLDESLEEKRNALKKKDAEDDTRSAIRETLTGSSRKSYRKIGPVKNAFVFRLNAYSTRTMSVTNGARSFGTVYSSPWYPEITVQYERQLYHHEVAGSVGISFTTGFGYYLGKGVMAVNLTNPVTGVAFGTESRTNVNGFVFPFYVGANYRLNLMKYVRPFAQAGVGTTGMLEVRSDSAKNRYAFGLGAQFSGGINIWMNSIDKRGADEMRDYEGVQNYYFTIDVTGYVPIALQLRYSNVVVSAGMTYEY
jgi:hypothetical protein